MVFKDHQKSIYYSTCSIAARLWMAIKRKFVRQQSGNIDSIYHRHCIDIFKNVRKKKKLSLVSVCCATRRKFIEKNTRTRWSTFCLMVHNEPKYFDMSFVIYHFEATSNEKLMRRNLQAFGKWKMPPTKVLSFDFVNTLCSKVDRSFKQIGFHLPSDREAPCVKFLVRHASLWARIWVRLKTPSRAVKTVEKRFRSVLMLCPL